MILNSIQLSCDNNQYIIYQSNDYDCSSNCSASGYYYYINSPTPHFCNNATNCNQMSVNENGTICLLSCNYLQNGQCISQCSTDYVIQSMYICTELDCNQNQYIQENFCVDQCTDEYAYPISGQNCSYTCNYYIENNAKYCYTSCDHFQTYNDGSRTVCNKSACQTGYEMINNECIDQCEGKPYMQNNVCVENCTEEYAYPTNGNVCSNTCNYIINNTQKYCYTNCTNYYTYQDDNSRTVCDLTRCQDNYIIQNDICVEDCQNKDYIQNNQCVYYCTGDYAKPLYGNVCSNVCNYYISISTKYCYYNCDNHLIYIINNRQVCDQLICNDGYNLQDTACVKNKNIGLIGGIITGIIIFISLIILVLILLLGKQSPINKNKKQAVQLSNNKQDAIPDYPTYI